MPQKVITVDLNGNYEGGGTAASPSYIRIEDGVTSGNVATVAQFHNTDNQALASTSYGLLAGGVTQIINGLGNLDRQRETGLDQVSNLGIVMGSQMFAQFFKTTVPATGTISSGAASATVTPASMTGILVGAMLTIDTGANAENVVVTALPSASTATIVPVNTPGGVPSFAHSHTPSYNVTGFLFNQERDASGEASGASGKGTAVAAEYEYTSGGPLAYSTGIPTLLQYDREVAALGKVASNAGAGYAITGTTAGNTSLTPTTPSQFATLTPGQWIRLSGSGTNEYVRVDDSYVISATPASIPLTNAVVNSSQTTATWDAFGANGPGQNPVLWTGEGFEGVLLNDAANAGFARAWQGDTNGNGKVVLASPYPTGATAITAASGNVAAATATATLAATASKTTYITGFEVTGTGATAALAVNVTVTNTITGTLTYTYAAAAGVAVANTPLIVQFPYPIPANAVNTTIVVSCPTLGAGNTNNTVVAHGFQL